MRSGYFDFAEYSSSLIGPEQIPVDDWQTVAGRASLRDRMVAV